MKIRLLVFFLMIPCFALSSSPAHAHGTAGRVKVNLSNETPAMDDFAYFIESHVNRERFAGIHEPWRDRFVVDRFEKMEQDGRSATVYFLVLDKNGNRKFGDSLTFRRSGEGSWEYITPEGKVLPVYTYVPKLLYQYRTYIRPLRWPVLGVGLVLLAISLWKRVRKSLQGRSKPRQTSKA
ncbi:MAG: hypothetical protein AAGU11_10370 [Syntrophobacteraceae bacterium]